MKKIGILVLAGLGVFGLASMLLAEKPLTLQECFQAALKQSEIIADQAELIQQAEEHYQQAAALLRPNLALNGSYGLQQTAAGNSPEQYQVELSLTQPLFRGFREFAAIRQSQALITSQQEARQWAGLQLFQDTAQVFYNVLALEKDLANLDNQLQLVRERIADLSARVQIGRSRTNEVLSVKSAEAILKAQRRQVKAQLDVTRRWLAFLTGLPETSQLDPLINLPAAIGTYENYAPELEKRPDLLAGRKKLEAFRENISVYQAGHWPTVDAGANYYLLRNGTQKDVHWDAQIALTLPLFAGGKIASQVREAESQYRQTELALQRLQRLNQTGLRQILDQLQADLEQVAALQEAADLAHQNYRAVVRDYNLSLVNNLEVLQAMTSDLDTQRTLDKARFSALIDFEQLAAICAQHLPLLGGN